MSARILIAIAAVATVTACAPRPDPATDTVAQAPPVRPVGAPVDCIQTNRILRTQVQNDRTIDFEMRGGPDYRNVLRNACPTLGVQRRFVYRSDVGQLCSIDTIQVPPPGGGFPGPTCGLGSFQPIERAPR